MTDSLAAVCPCNPKQYPAAWHTCVHHAVPVQFKHPCHCPAGCLHFHAVYETNAKCCQVLLRVWLPELLSHCTHHWDKSELVARHDDGGMRVSLGTCLAVTLPPPFGTCWSCWAVFRCDHPPTVCRKLGAGVGINRLPVGISGILVCVRVECGGLRQESFSTGGGGGSRPLPSGVCTVTASFSAGHDCK